MTNPTHTCWAGEALRRIVSDQLVRRDDAAMLELDHLTLAVEDLLTRASSAVTLHFDNTYVWVEERADGVGVSFQLVVQDKRTILVGRRSICRGGEVLWRARSAA